MLQNVNIFEGFKVDKEENLYKLTCGQVVEDPLGLADGWFSVNGMPFSTQDTGIMINTQNITQSQLEALVDSGIKIALECISTLNIPRFLKKINGASLDSEIGKLIWD